MVVTASENVRRGQSSKAAANDDNVVNVIDFNILRNTFGKAIGDPNYDDRADFNGDNRITVVDVNLHKVNMGTSGGPPISPGNP